MTKEKSTNVRIITETTKVALRLLEALSPKWAGEIAGRMFLSAPPRRKNSAEEEAILRRGEHLRVAAGDDELSAWRFGEGPAVLLVHGWGGSGAQLSRFVDPLLEAGFSVVTFDGPAHGRSTGRLASLVHFGAAILEVAKTVGPIEGVIAHSVGSAATAIALRRGLELERAVFIGPPSDAKVWFDGFSSVLQLTQRVKDAAQRSVEQLVGVYFDELNARMIGWPASTDLLVIHDRKDREVPFSDGELIARLSGGKLTATEGLGHRRILADPNVVATAVRFFAPEAASLQAILDRELSSPWVRPSAA